MQNLREPLPQIDFRTRFPALDGLRGIALIVVFMAHFGFFFASGKVWRFFSVHAYISIDLWFVLSGFLITGILYDTRADSQFFKRFYLRRAIRTFPIFYLVAVLLVVLTPVVHLYWRSRQYTFLIYLGNYFANHAPSLYIVPSRLTGLFAVQLAHLWSLCVEEQFYLVWPLIVWMVPSRVRLLQVTAGLCCAGLLLRTYWVLRFLGPTDNQLPFRNLPLRLDSLLLGAILALVLRGPSADRWQRLCRWIFPLCSAILLLLYTVIPRPGREYLSNTVGYTLIAVASAALVGCTLPPAGALARWLSLPALRFLGKYSYGFYIFHLLPIYAWVFLNGWLGLRFHHALATGFGLVVLIFFVNLLLAKLSYDLFEVRFLRLKRYLRYDAENSAVRGVALPD